MMQGKNVMKKPVSNYMSANELKVRLFDRFREIGALDGLQTQLRSKLIDEMLKVSSPSKKVDENARVDSKATLLPLQVSNWLVYDHLKRLGFEYSLSTFVSESKLTNPESLLSIRDVLSLIGYDTHSSEYESLYNDYKKNESFIFIFLKSVAKHTKNSHVQNHTKIGPKPNAMQEVESFFPSKIFNGIFAEGASSSGIGSFKEDGNFALHQYLKLEKEKHEKEIQSLRQKLIKELDSLHDQEQKARFEVEQMRSRLTLEKEMFDMEKQKLKMKELELKLKEDHLDKEIEAKMILHKENILNDTEGREVISWETKLNEQQQWLEKELSKIKDDRQELESLKTRLLHMEKSYKSLENDYTVILHENNDLHARLKAMSDYSVIKEELSWKSNKLESCEREIMLLKSEMQAEKLASLNTIQRLQQQLLHSAPKQLIESYKQPLDYNQTFSLNQQAQSMQQEYREMRQLYETVLTRIVEQKGDIQELHRLIHDLYNEVSQRKKSNLHLNNEKENPPIYVSENIPPNYATNQNIQEPKSHSRNTFPHEKYIEKPLKFVSEVKKRIDNLQKESEALEKKYSDFLSSVPWIPHVPVSSNSNLFNDFLSTFEMPVHDFFYLDELRTPNLKADYSKIYHMASEIDMAKDADYRNAKKYFFPSKDVEFPSDLNSGIVKDGRDIDTYSLITGFSNPKVMSHLDQMNRSQSDFRTLNELSAVRRNVTLTASGKEKDHSKFSNPTEEILLNEGAQKEHSINSPAASISLHSENGVATSSASSSIPEVISNFQVSYKEKETNLTSPKNEQIANSTGNHQSPHTSEFDRKSENNKPPLDIMKQTETPTDATVPLERNQENLLKHSITENSTLGGSRGSSAGADVSVDSQQMHSVKSAVEANTSPFRRRRRFFITPPQGCPLIDLDEVWQKRKSVDAEILNTASNSVDGSENLKTSINNSEISTNNPVNTEEVVNHNTVAKDASVGLSDEKSTVVEKEQDLRRTEVLVDNGATSNENSKELHYPDVQSSNSVEKEIVNVNTSDKSEIGSVPDSKSSNSLQNADLPALEHSPSAKLDCNHEKTSTVFTEHLSQKMSTGEISDEENEQVDSNVSEMSELKLSAGSAKEQSQGDDSNDDAW